MGLKHLAQGQASFFLVNPDTFISAWECSRSQCGFKPAGKKPVADESHNGQGPLIFGQDTERNWEKVGRSDSRL